MINEMKFQPDPDIERILVALGCKGDSLHDLLIAAEALRAENERLEALVDSVLECDGSDRTTHIAVEIPFDLYHALEEARRER